MPENGTNAMKNFLFLLSDEHNASITGCYGHPIVQTPNLDRLAAGGTRFQSAYCNSPICVPSRTALATGMHPHQTRSWDNATPYTGAQQSWHHVMRDNGVDVASIGKLHFRGGDDYGFTEELLPLHVVDGKGDLKAIVARQSTNSRKDTSKLAADAGPGESSYQAYDRAIAAQAREWIEARAARGDDRPFTLFVSFVMPHFPLIAPQEYYDLYAGYSLEELSQGLCAAPSDHPTMVQIRTFMDYDRHFDDESRARALRAYFGMVTMLDALIGTVLKTLEDSPFAQNTGILYSSDHGDNLGNHGHWGKSVMYDDSAAVPMILAGPGVPQNHVAQTPVSLIDVAPTALRAVGLETQAATCQGQSLFEIARHALPDRAVLVQYHAAGAPTGVFMIRKGDWKYVYFSGAAAQLFNLANDRDEVHDRASDPECAAILAELEGELRAICDPDAVTRQAFADQQAVIDLNGGPDAIYKTRDIPFTPAPV